MNAELLSEISDQLTDIYYQRPYRLVRVGVWTRQSDVSTVWTCRLTGQSVTMMHIVGTGCNQGQLQLFGVWLMLAAWRQTMTADQTVTRSVGDQS